MAYGVGPGDAISTSPFTFIATAEVIHLLGAIPVFVVIDPFTFNISLTLLEKTINALNKKEGVDYPLPKQHPLPLKPKGIIATDETTYRNESSKEIHK
jgi:dTDP-4-amino-4,6-dideoxygalactose transaminase